MLTWTLISYCTFILLLNCIYTSHFMYAYQHIHRHKNVLHHHTRLYIYFKRLYTLLMLKRLLIVTTIQLLQSASNLVKPIENAVGMATRLIYQSIYLLESIISMLEFPHSTIISMLEFIKVNINVRVY